MIVRLWKPALVFATAVLCAVAVFFALSDERNLLVVQGPSALTKGKKFDVVIGDPIQTAENKLLKLQGIRPYEVTQGGGCAGRQYGTASEVRVYREDTWRHGIVCLIAENGVIKEISWTYSFLPAFF